MKKVKMLKFCLQYLLYSIVLKNLAWESKMFIIQNLLNITDIVHSNKILWNCNKNINFGNMRFFHVQLFSNQIIQNSWQTFRSIRVNGERICGMNDYHTRKTRKIHTEFHYVLVSLYYIHSQIKHHQSTGLEWVMTDPKHNCGSLMKDRVNKFRDRANIKIYM